MQAAMFLGGALRGIVSEWASTYIHAREWNLLEHSRRGQMTGMTFGRVSAILIARNILINLNQSWITRDE